MKATTGLVELLAGALLAAGVGCSPASDSSRAHAVYESVRIESQGAPLAASGIEAETFDFQSKGPLEFLEFLESSYAQAASNPSNLASYTVWGTHRDWIRESDIPELIRLFDSTRPCLPVAKAISSIITNQPSTVGQEAAFLVEGFRCDVEKVGYGGYPPALNSDRRPPDGQAIRAWWEKYHSSR